MIPIEPWLRASDSYLLRISPKHDPFLLRVLAAVPQDFEYVVDDLFDCYFEA